MVQLATFRKCVGPKAQRALQRLEGVEYRLQTGKHVKTQGANYVSQGEGEEEDTDTDEVMFTLYKWMN